MRNFILHIALFLVIVCAMNQSYAQKKTSLTGNINNYANQPLRLYKCFGDSLLFVDSTRTDKKGEFAFSMKGKVCMYKIALPQNQFFYILSDGHPVEIRTLCQFNAFYNIATDSLVVLKSEDNKRFYEYQHLQGKLNIANYWLLQMMRLYPLPDPFHKQIEDEYFARYNEMEQFIKNSWQSAVGNRQKKMTMNDQSMEVALAYYQPINPDWKQPDPWRDSIKAAHYFDYFNPADSFYLHTNILPEKIDLYLTMRTDKRDAYGQPIYDEMLVAEAAQDFMEKVKNNSENFEFCLNYLLKSFRKAHKETAFLHLYDLYLKPKEGDCEAEDNQFNWAREIANKLRNIAIGSTAPDFELSDKLQLSGIQSDYTLVLFWASWCPHCTQAVPEIKKAVDEFNERVGKRLLTVAVSLDTNKEQWQKFVSENNLLSFLNFSELKGWKSEVVKKYNVYATPTMFLLDKDKKIISKPITIGELKGQLGMEARK